MVFYACPDVEFLVENVDKAPKNMSFFVENVFDKLYLSYYGFFCRTGQNCAAYVIPPSIFGVQNRIFGYYHLAQAQSLLRFINLCIIFS